MKTGARSPVFFGGVFAIALMLSGCAVDSPQQRREGALSTAQRAGWQPQFIDAGRFRLLTLQATNMQAPEIAVYIEGDGLAWIDPRTPSKDPTPRTPTGLHLALADPHRPAVYLGRPCQYDPDAVSRQCRVRDWTDSRFSSEIVEAMNQAVTRIKATAGAETLVLVGYSGGGTMAALLAARRDDVSLLVTVAAVLDHQAWTQRHRLSPLTGSLNPVDDWQVLQHVRQVHYVGADDQVTGRAAVEPFLARFAPGRQPPLNAVAGFGHTCCWATAWPKLAPH